MGKEYTTSIPEIKLSMQKSDFNKVKITCSSDAYKYIRQFYLDDIEIYESCFILLLNRQNNTIGFAKISQGGVAGTVVDIRIVCKYAVESLCSSIILAHNHPSGNLNPSNQDKNLTDNLKNALKLFDVQLFDHLILTDLDYYSFADNGNL